jgi:hypothetical protein
MNTPETKAGQLWLVKYECRTEVVRISAANDGFFAPGQDPLWHFDNIQSWIFRIYDPEEGITPHDTLCAQSPPTAAYCEGYADGYLRFDARRVSRRWMRGYDDNPYDFEGGAFQAEYRHGYDAGVSAYCRDHHPEDENA